MTKTKYTELNSEEEIENFANQIKNSSLKDRFSSQESLRINYVKMMKDKFQKTIDNLIFKFDENKEIYYEFFYGKFFYDSLMYFSSIGYDGFMKNIIKNK